MKQAHLHKLSKTIARIVPQILQGVRLDFLAGQTITYTQFLLLVAIYSRGRPAMNTLARSMHVSMPTATGLVNRLARGGYVRRSRGEEKDRRCVTVELSVKGLAFIRKFQGVVSHRWFEVLQSFDSTDLDRLEAVMRRLEERMKAQALK